MEEVVLAQRGLDSRDEAGLASLGLGSRWEWIPYRELRPADRADPSQSQPGSGLLSRLVFNL